MDKCSAHDPEIAGSIPVTCTFFFLQYQVVMYKRHVLPSPLSCLTSWPSG